jgi:hypothetical protein
MEKENKKVRINANLSETMYKRLKAISDDCGLTMSALVTVAVMNFMDQKDVLKLSAIYEKAERENAKDRASELNKK